MQDSKETSTCSDEGDIINLFLYFNENAFQVEISASGLPSFCTCGHCQIMPTRPENICCSDKKFLIKMPKGVCVISHEDFGKIINKTVLTLRLKSLWSSGVFETDTQELCNENLRYSGYRSLFLWLLKEGSRSSLPSCVVKTLRNTYPDPNETYTGFVPKSPVFKRSKRTM